MHVASKEEDGKRIAKQENGVKSVWKSEKGLTNNM